MFFGRAVGSGMTALRRARHGVLGLGTATTAGLTFLVPVGSGVHYVFGER